MSGFVSECKLDCFGMAVCVIAACQALQLDDVHLALSEDHAWAVFNDLQESVEITWHGNISTASIALNIVKLLFLEVWTSVARLFI